MEFLNIGLDKYKYDMIIQVLSFPSRPCVRNPSEIVIFISNILTACLHRHDNFSNPNFFYKFIVSKRKP